MTRFGDPLLCRPAGLAVDQASGHHSDLLLPRLEDPSVRTLLGLNAARFKPASIRRPVWIARIGTALLAPVIVLGAIELGLRLAGFGYPTSYFLETRIR